MNGKPEDNVWLGSWTFNVIKLHDIDLYSDYIKKTEYEASLWSSNFAYLWAISQSELRKILWKIVDGMLVTFVYSYKNTLYLSCLPFGKGGPDKVTKVLLKCLKFCYDWNYQNSDKTTVKMINSCQLEFLRKCSDFDKNFSLTTWQGIERHFDVNKLSTLTGKEFANIRNRVNKFYRDNPKTEICYYQDKDYNELMELGKRWQETSGKKYSNIFDRVYFKEIIGHSNELRQMTLIIKINGKTVGMVSGSELPTGQSWGSLIKFEPGIQGLSETLIVEYARELNKLNPKIEFMNVGSDLGEGGLREYKLKFRPVLNYKRYQLRLKQPE